MTLAITFFRQNDAGSRVSNTQYWKKKKSRTPSCLRLRSFIPLMYQYLSAYDNRPPMYNNTCGVQRPTEPPTTVPITTIEDVIGGRYHRRVVAWDYVNMVVASICFAFGVLITQAQIWKSFWVENSTNLLYLPPPLSAETRKIFGNMLCPFRFA